MIILACLLFLGVTLNVNIGSVSIRAGAILTMLWDALRFGAANLFTHGAYEADLRNVLTGTTESRILFSIRLPRMMLAAVLGGALSVSGYLLQVFFRNPIAGPFVLGISSGAKMVVGITLIFLSGYMGHVSSVTLIIAAFAGSMVVTLLVLVFSQKVNNMSMLLVVGIMVGYICSAATDFSITFASEHDVVNLTNWSMGSFSGASWSNVGLAAVICLIGTAAAMLISKPIGAYALGEGYAVSLGINIKALRAVLVIFSSVLSACVTALAGPISFVGVAVPHITRSVLSSSRPVFVIPASFLCGAVFCVMCDLIARTLFAPTELMIGTVTSVFGAPIVIYMMIKRKRAGEQ
ncbi:MAG: iron ABC transporter permease [Clostridia bacterium]|nr:iron ABC transporter permease [Clostridia bacterium]MBQ1375328.1 iron ABC transporter permease [Clostridia bacterium]MBQ1434758.1 iron ABC transporter permease [Clostridia bacterium]MBQ4250003.1 iron ABC transporter permease [Clostridia bacterium]